VVAALGSLGVGRAGGERVSPLGWATLIVTREYRHERDGPAPSAARRAGLAAAASGGWRRFRPARRRAARLPLAPLPALGSRSPARRGRRWCPTSSSASNAAAASPGARLLLGMTAALWLRRACGAQPMAGRRARHPSPASGA
jgi:hypothetical protein